ncbi:hypothetical protein I6F31_05545 [Bradyrhizobium sp. NBAIM01]|nr:hypothetical protein [Bradyrhizobium sp. NBAIM01]
MLALIGATPDGKKELIGFEARRGRERPELARALIYIRRQGLQVAPELAVGEWRTRLPQGDERRFPRHAAAAMLTGQGHQCAEQGSELSAERHASYLGCSKGC